MGIKTEDFLAHHGVKGMKWGVRKVRDSSPTSRAHQNERTKAYLASAPSSTRLSKKQQEDAVSKLEQTYVEKQGFKITKKHVLIGAGIALAVGGAYAVKKSDLKPSEIFDRFRGGYPKEGAKVSADEFRALRYMSQSKIPGAGQYVTPKSYLQGEMTFPPGHVFSRLSSQPETDFKEHTFSLSNKADFDRYLSEFSREGVGDLHEITFASTKSIRVPSLTQRLDVLKETMGARGTTPSDSDVLREYESMMKTYWTEPKSKAYLGELVKRGYDAIIDDMDAGIAGESPLLLINSSAFGAKSSRKLTSQDVELSRNSLTEIKNRK